jgi:tetratricopeptide (TPR) repeat protein
MVIGEARTNHIQTCLITKGQTLYRQCKYSEAKIVYEEAYNLIVELFNPGHPEVLKVANYMINTLIQLFEFEDAARYARISYECQKGTGNPESLEVADAPESLSSVIYQLILRNGPESGDIMEAEKLAKTALHMKERIFGRDHSLLQSALFTLSKVLRQQGKENEAKDLLERNLAVYSKKDSVSTQHP